MGKTKPKVKKKKRRLQRKAEANGTKKRNKKATPPRVSDH